MTSAHFIAGAQKNTVRGPAELLMNWRSRDADAVEAVPVPD
jgi:hypothetical protein